MRTLFAAIAAVAVAAAVSACTLFLEGSSNNVTPTTLPDASAGEPDAEIIPPEDAGGPVKDGGDCCGTPDADPGGGCGGPDGGFLPDAEVPPDAA
jgi:hypothetical protein